MGSDRLKKDLERLHRTEALDVQNVQRSQALEEDLLLRYRKTHSQKKRLINMLNPHNRLARFAVLGLAMLLLGVGACSTETTTEVEVGKQVSISLPPGAGSFDKSVDLDAQIHEMVDLLANSAGVEGVNVNLNEDDGMISLSIVLFGDGLDSEALVNMVRNDFPELADAEIVVDDLQGTITESWAERFGRQVFQIETDGATDEEIRAQVLQQLAEQGFEGEAEVNVTTEGDEQRIEIKLTEEEEVVE